MTYWCFCIFQKIRKQLIYNVLYWFYKWQDMRLYFSCKKHLFISGRESEGGKESETERERERAWDRDREGERRSDTRNTLTDRNCTCVVAGGVCAIKCRLKELKLFVDVTLFAWGLFAEKKAYLQNTFKWDWRRLLRLAVFSPLFTFTSSLWIGNMIFLLFKKTFWRNSCAVTLWIWPCSRVALPILFSSS